MADRTPVPGTRALVVFCASLALLATGCGEQADHGKPSPSSSSKGGGNPVSTPTASRPVPSDGKGSKDPDDINGDGHRDLLVPLPSRSQTEDGRTGVVFGSAKGLDPSTHAVYDYAAGTVTTADLDGDGYPDFVTMTTEKVPEEESKNGWYTDRQRPVVNWGGPGGPRTGAEVTRIQIPAGGPGVDLTAPERGDFDGDGHHDIAALRQDGSVVLLYGPFTRSGAAARTDTRPGRGSWLAADDIDPSGEPRATGLLVHEGDDGEQTGAVLYPARDGSGLSRTSIKLREGNAVAFGDYDGDGTGDVAIGDNGSRNNEPDVSVEGPKVTASLAVYPGKGGAPTTYKIPKSRENSYYGPGDYASADPDGDGKDGILVATDDGALLIDGEKRTKILRGRQARPYAAADFDADGKEELILGWSRNGQDPTRWWITDGTSRRDMAAFATRRFAGRG
ncbi:FG-GAP repeat domain-containing protein [Streptomyces sp. NPDC054871]